MKIFITLTLAALLILPVVGATPAVAQEPEEKTQKTDESTQAQVERDEDEDEPEEPVDPVKESLNQALGKFYMALNAMLRGDAEPMKEVWSHSPDVTYMPPDGKYLMGWDETLKSWEQQASLKPGGSVIPKELHYNIGETIAVVHNYEQGSNVIDGEKKTVNIRVTTIFRKEDGEWKMIGHHTDLLPFLIKQEK